jgi:beta-mannanase
MKQITKNVMRPIMAAVTCAAIGVGLAIGSPLSGTAEQGQYTGKRMVLTEDSIRFGAYDPHGDFAGESRASIEHIFMPWEDVDLSDLQRVDAYALERGRELLITVEPWSWAKRVTDSSALLTGILSGDYDSTINTVCSAISELDSPVNIRWGQEMEDPTGPFPWARWSPPDFIAAYRHFVTECRKVLPNAQYVWSPKGIEPLLDFYPGDEYVDEIGLSVFGYQPYDKLAFGGERTFVQALEPGYRLVEGFGKPIIVAELGYEGDQDYITRWANSVTMPHEEFPGLTAVVYFNTVETFQWPLNMGRPDWRIGSPPTVSRSAAEPGKQSAREPDCEALANQTPKVTTDFGIEPLCN